MLRYVLWRLLLTIPILLGVTVICFALIQIAPGDPLQSLLSPDATEADIAQLRAHYGLDRPLPVQYAIWLGNAFTGDLGRSISTNAPVAQEVLGAFRNTIGIALIAVLLAFLLSMAMGVTAALRCGTWVDRATTGFAIVSISVPTFWLSIVLVIIFAVNLNWLPAMGMGADGTRFSYFHWDDLKYAVMPVIALAMQRFGIMMRTTKAAVSEVIGQEFVHTLRAKGLGKRRIMRHILKNATPQILGVSGLQLGYVLGGSILVEIVFNWPGTGSLLNKAILSRDIPLLQGTILFLALAFVLINLVVDVLQSVVDPRIKRA